MKKFLILLLVLGLVSIANATVTMELREADGVTPVGDLDALGLTSAYVLVIGGASADAGASVGLYGPSYTTADWDNLGPGGQSAATVVDTGDMSYITWVASWQGYDMLADDSGTGGPGVATGDWFTIDLTGLMAGTFDLDLLDYNAGSTVIDSISGTVLPEPMTIALLGLGGLFLRRRK